MVNGIANGAHNKSVLIMAGGTGGHVFPGLATAAGLMESGVVVTWLGTRAGIESKLVPAAGIPISYISVSGVRGKNVLQWLKSPFQILRAIYQSIQIIHRDKPHCVLGMGGFASGPGGIAAWLSRKPLVIQEQNAVAGTTNRLLARIAKRVALGMPGTKIPSSRSIHTGNPVRTELAEVVAPKQRLTKHAGRLKLLVLGGSLGASILNETVPEAMSLIKEQQRPEVWHQVGEKHLAQAQEIYRQHQVSARIDPFIADMAQAYAWADIVVCRAGALTVSELAVVGLGSILVPFPAAIDDHQTKNAQWLADNGAALLIPQNQLTAVGLARQLEDLSRNREAVLAMAEKARVMGKPDAQLQVARLCLEVACG